MNNWLAKMCVQVTKDMNEKPYATVDMAAFKEAIETFENLEEIEREKERIIVSLQKIKADCDSLIRDVDKKFEV